MYVVLRDLFRFLNARYHTKYTSVAWTSRQRPPIVICEVTPRSHKGGTEYFLPSEEKVQSEKPPTNFSIFYYIFPTNTQKNIYIYSAFLLLI